MTAAFTPSPGLVDAEGAMQSMEIMRRQTIAAYEFERGYLERSQAHYPDLTLESLREHSRVVPCRCRSADCEGWGMVSLDSDTCGICGEYEWRHPARTNALDSHVFTRERYWPLP